MLRTRVFPIILVYLVRFKLRHITVEKLSRIFETRDTVIYGAKHNYCLWLTEDFKPDIGLIKEAENFCIRLSLGRKIMQHVYKLPVATEEDVIKFQALQDKFVESKGKLFDELRHKPGKK